MVLVVLVLAAFSAPAFAAGAPQPVRDARDSVVRIMNYVSDDEIYSGTGFAVGTEEDIYIVTNYHVVEDAEEIYVMYDTGKYVEATVYEESEPRDLAVLKLKKDIPGLVPLTLETGEIDTGMAVYALGYPGAADVLAQGLEGYDVEDKEELLHAVIADKQSMTMTNGIISAIVDSSLIGDGSRKVKLIQTNTAINHGNSGGPLLDEEGNVVGINTIGLASLGVEAMNGSIHVEELEKLLKTKKIEYLEPVEEEEVVEVAPNHTVLIVVLVLVGLAIIGAVVGIMLYRRSRQKSGGIAGGVSFAEFERSGKVLNEVTVNEMVKNFLATVIPLENQVDVNLLLSPDNVAVGDNQIVLKSKKPGRRGATTLEIYPGYSAPENYKNRASAASCVYFVGGMMYCLLTGQRPTDALTRVDENQPVFSGGDTLQGVINQAMEPHAQNRIASLYQLQQTLVYATNQVLMENAPPQQAWPAQPDAQWGQQGGWQQPPAQQPGAWPQQQPNQPQQWQQPQQGGWQQPGPQQPQQPGQPPQSGPYGY